MSESEIQAELERLRAENAQLKSKDKGGLTLKVSEKGGLSRYGMGRFLLDVGALLESDYNTICCDVLF
jgi:hypothetical protein